MKRNLYTILLAFSAILLFQSCKKTPDYVAEPYACECGSLKWNNEEYQLLDASFIHTDGYYSRRYYITAKVKLPGEAETHSLNTWIELPDVTSSLVHQIEPDDTLFQFSSVVHEFNVNDPLDTLRTFIPVQGVLNTTPAIFGGTESVQFYMLLNELQNGIPSGSPIQYNGSFTVEVEPQ